MEKGNEKKIRGKEELDIAYQNKSKDDAGTPFDSVFKTECKKLKKYLAPLIKEMFGLDSECMDVLSDIMPEEHYLLDGKKYGNPVIVKRFSDSCIRIGDRFYHVECQSTVDGDILVRLAEYNVMIGLDNAEFDRRSETVTIRLPKSSLMMLRAGGKDRQKLSSMMIRYIHEEQSIIMEVPVMNVQAYSTTDIYSKKLFYLIPFYSLRYEDDFKKWAADKLVGGDECDRIYLELRRFFLRLEKAYKTEEISENDARNLAEMSLIILKHLTINCSDALKERVVNVMGGQVLELQDDRWLKEGKVLARFEDGMDIKEIAVKTEMSEDEVIKILEENGMLQPQQ